MKKDKVRLMWFLDFLTIDIDNLPRGDFFKLLVDIGSTFYHMFLVHAENGKFPFADTPNMRKEVKESQEHLKKILDSLLGAETGPHALFVMGSVEGWGEPSEIRQDLRGTVISTVTIEEKIVKVKDKVFMIPGSTKDTMLTYFILSLADFSLDDIKRCMREDCGKYFLKAHKKEKRYCSDRCAWVVNSRERRKAGTKR